ncbi:SDR family NAD(P)-dependent oxidoreductase [Echinicola marina]|uniref:SDR family NAD(P)-dependent oxidoreductase n=1 Tax=Echinicola marina TaxID=2859768 RepID=UPI001CF6192F|nr:SDR family NAD(P)-dependent oxidoreductase [Echinicola marina]UCS93448.1 SDR family NAD(P)-dependent oxidoreductase [Echinicola marina]
MKHLFILTGCSKGLGKALLGSLLENKENHVLGISRSAMQEQERFVHIQLDLADTTALINVLPEVFPEGDFEKVVLINNAGWIGEIAPLGKLDPVGILKIHTINVVAPAILINEYVKKYADREMEKLVVNISSGAAVKDIDGWSGYSSSKSALNRISGVAQEESDLNGYGIRYFALAPGIVDTPMQEDIRSAKSADFSGLEKFRSFKSNNELSSPVEVSKKVIYLIEHSDLFKGVIQDVRKF